MSNLEQANRMLEFQNRQITHDHTIRGVEGMQMLQEMEKKQSEESRRYRKLHAAAPAPTTGQPLTPSPSASGPVRIPRKDNNTIVMELKHLREQLRFFKKWSPLSPENIARNSRVCSPQKYIETEITKKEFALCQLKKQLKQQKEQK